MISSCGQPGRGPGRVVLFGLYPHATLSPLARSGSGVTLAEDVAVLPSQFLRAIRWVAYRMVLAEPVASRRFRQDEAREAFECFWQSETVKGLFEMQRAGRVTDEKVKTQGAASRDPARWLSRRAAGAAVAWAILQGFSGRPIHRRVPSEIVIGEP